MPQMDPDALPSVNDKVIIKAMVGDLYTIVEDMYHRCSVCAVLGGVPCEDHESGRSCGTLPLDENVDRGWRLFKDSFILSTGLVCYNCLLPFVSFPFLMS